MADFLMIAAIVVLVSVALGLVRVLRGPGKADRMMAAQLSGTGGIAILLLAEGGGHSAAADVALGLALLAALAAVVFVKCGGRTAGEGDS
jgi:multicomponent Na+:H+ antiporter subunit F